MHSTNCILKVVIDTPLRKIFDYLPPANLDESILVPGLRLRVPFGKSKKVIGLLLEVTDITAISKHKLKRVESVLDSEPIFGQELLNFMHWARDYYHQPAGDVFLGTLPRLIRTVSILEVSSIDKWETSEAAVKQTTELLKNSPKQKAIYDYINSHKQPLTSGQLSDVFTNWRIPLKQLEGKKLVRKATQENGISISNKFLSDFKLNPEQEQAVSTITSRLNDYHPCLLYGITGSGKTEVYIKCIQEVIKNNRQALVLLPEIGLTTQFINYFKSRLGLEIAVMHSGLTDRERLNTWLRTRDGNNRVLLGTRSALWTPFKNLGLIVVDEEHDLSYKQQENFRYSARDLALLRAHQARIPIILGSATPSMESIYNVMQGKYRELYLGRRAAGSRLPDILIKDIRGENMTGAFSTSLLEQIEINLQKNEQTLLFLNRRGFAPVYMCHDCGAIMKCPRCEIRMTYHKSTGRLHCHHCDHQERIPGQCPQCSGENMIEIGHGTQRAVETLETLFPKARISRIDRDSTRRKGSMETMLKDINEGNVDIMIGTQMLAMGHHFPGVTLVGIIDADHGLHSADYRASERMGQLIMQVSGRAGRGDKPGMVYIQSHFPDHPLLLTLKAHDYKQYSSLLLKERADTGLPPYTCQALIRTESNSKKHCQRFLQEARQLLAGSNISHDVFGPFIPPIEKRAGRYRMQLLLQTENRKLLGKLLAGWIPEIEQLQSSRKVRWSLDVDPQDML